LQIKTKIVSCQLADSKPVKQEVNGTLILPPLVFPGSVNKSWRYAPMVSQSLLDVYGLSVKENSSYNFLINERKKSFGKDNT
jgi:hypothetical protein